MVVGAFPAAKLGVLAFKQLSKPVANVIKDRAKNNPFFRQYVCMPPAQFYNWVEVTTKMWAMNLGRPVKVPQLNETMAIELGANLLGEVIIFSIGAGLLIFEYVRQVNKETKKEELVKQEKAELNQVLCELQLHIERQDAQMREMTRVLADLDSRRWFSKKLNFMQVEQKDDNNNSSSSSGQSDAKPINSDAEETGPEATRVCSLATASQVLRKAGQSSASDDDDGHGNYTCYDPRRGLVFEALHLIETEVFYSERIFRSYESYGRVQSALAYLGYAPPSKAPASDATATVRPTFVVRATHTTKPIAVRAAMAPVGPAPVAVDLDDRSSSSSPQSPPASDDV